MAVYTAVEFAEIEALVAPLGLGRLIAARGVAEGVENTTYFLDVAGDHSEGSAGQYVLTIAETIGKSDLEFIARLMRDLNARGLPVPTPIMSGDYPVLSARGKPALLVPRIAGKHPQSISPALCRHLGAMVAELHHVTSALTYQHDSHRSLEWVAATGQAVLPHLAPTDQLLLTSELAWLEEFVSTNISLPKALIHGDLFRDNVLTQGNTIVALIDFFSAGTGYLLLDLAIVVNDWCLDAQGTLNTHNYNALLEGYEGVRELESVERQQWGQLLRVAALRFWISRLSEQLIAELHAARGRGKDPLIYRRLLLLHRDAPLKWPLCH